VKEKKKEALNKAVGLVEKLEHLFVATADASGLPHVAASHKASLIPNGALLSVEAWFCPGTMANLKVNRHIALVVWDPKTDEGYQLLGEAEEFEDVLIMDGYAPEVEGTRTLPQVERRLVIQVDRILRFSHAPHADEEE